ncbi:MAG: RluA family pseudouridine synthase [Verrucomicrobia bacterium]|nr:RluA family pseudouridine synthase [Verrucomicrobiota bacterium]
MASPIKLSNPATREFWEIDPVYEDEHLLALNKPARLLSSPDRYDPERPNLMRLLHEGIASAKPWAKERDLTYLSNAHRLDFETTGIMLLAKSRPVLVELANLFGSNKPIKTYVAFVNGCHAQPKWTVTAPIGPHPHRAGLMRVDPRRGKNSRTEFTTLEKFGRWSLVSCRPITGRTHQIRVHLQKERLPICGDTLYGGRPLKLSAMKKRYDLKEGREERPLLATTALHAEKLELVHPVTGVRLEIKAPWPKDLVVALKYLRRYSSERPPEPDPTQFPQQSHSPATPSSV